MRVDQFPFQEAIGHLEENSAQSLMSISLEALLEVVPDAVVVVDPQGVVVGVNIYAEKMFGYRKAEIIGQPVEALMPEALREIHAGYRDIFSAQPYRRAMGAELELLGLTKEGNEFPVDIMLCPISDMGTYYLFAFIRDLSLRVNEQQRAERVRNEVQHRLLDLEEYERQRLAQALHDGPLQELHSVDFELVALARELEDKELREHLLELRATLRQVARHVRAVCQDLRPPSLTPFGVSAVIRSYADAFQVEHPDLEVVLELEEDGQSLPESIRLTIYRICQHALRNVAQHAKASRVIVTLKIQGNAVDLEVADNGIGFTLPAKWPDLVQENKFGLLGCIERTEAVNGTIQIRSRPENGSVLLVTVPIPVGPAAN